MLLRWHLKILINEPVKKSEFFQPGEDEIEENRLLAQYSIFLSTVNTFLLMVNFRMGLVFIPQTLLKTEVALSLTDVTTQKTFLKPIFPLMSKVFAYN